MESFEASCEAEDVEKWLPHRPPMLLLDRIERVESGKLWARKTFRGDEFFLQGHFPERAVVPGVILCECALQAGAALLWRSATVARDVQRLPVVTRMNNVRFKQTVLPGDSVLIEVELTEQMAGAFFFTGKVTCNEKVALYLEFACTLVEKDRV
jgi:3-hydroxyacyl-[acyl-carrier-protein] dehydratase